MQVEVERKMDERKGELLGVLKPVAKALEELRLMDTALAAALREPLERLIARIREMEAVPDWEIYRDEPHLMHRWLVLVELRARRQAAALLDPIHDVVRPITEWIEKELMGGSYVFQCDQDKSHQFFLPGSSGWAAALWKPSEVERRTGGMFSVDSATGEIHCHVCQPDWMFAGLYLEER